MTKPLQMLSQTSQTPSLPNVSNAIARYVHKWSAHKRTKLTFGHKQSKPEPKKKKIYKAGEVQRLAQNGSIADAGHTLPPFVYLIGTGLNAPDRRQFACLLILMVYGILYILFLYFRFQV